MFRENKGEDLDRVSSLRDVRQSIPGKGGGTDRVGNRRGA